jgi:hypothetical protein
MSSDPGNDPSGTATDVRRRCVFDLSLNCGHLATVAIDGWYPVSVSCCDRLGGTALNGNYVPYDSQVEYVNVLSETYEDRPHGAPREPTQLLGRRPRTDDPYVPPYSWAWPSAGRFPARVGATWIIGGSTTPAAHT